MTLYKNIRGELGSWAARHQKATLVLLAVFIGYGFFHFGLDASSWIVTAWRVVTLLIIVFLLLSPFERVRAVKIESGEGRDKQIDIQPRKKDGGDSFRKLSNAHLVQYRRNREKDYALFLTRILSIIKKTFAAQTAAIYLFDSDAGSLSLESVVSDEDDLIKDKSYMPDEKIFGKIFQDNGSFLSNDPEEVTDLLPYYPKAGAVSSAIGVPVIIENEINGILIIDSFEHNAYSEDDIPLVETYGGIISETIINYNSLFEFEYSAQLFSFFYEVSRGLISNLKFEEILDLFLSVMKDVIEYDRLTISEYEMGNDQAKIIRVDGQVNDFPEGTLFPLDEGLTGWIIRKKESICITDPDGDLFRPRYKKTEKTNYNLQSFVGVPISYHDICFGVLAVESFTPKKYGDQDEKILVMLANNFGVALERSHALKQLELHATTDGLTSLHNYRSFMQNISNEIERAVRYNLKFTLLMIDIDHFKEVNDGYGHLAGDRVLIQVASIIKKSTRNVDIVCRYGGEEFAVILVETVLQVALSTAERIRKNIEQLNTHYKKHIIGVTVSVGAVEFPNSSKNVENLIHEADKALYNAKSKGRNRVVSYQNERESVA